MSDPYDTWLADAVDAARECAREDAPSAREGAATRARIHASLETRRGTSKRRLTLISAVVASLFGSTAFAYYAGWRPFTQPAPTPEPAAIASPPAEPAAPGRRASHARADAQPEPMVAIVTPTPTPMPTPTPSPTAESPSPRPRPIPKPTPTPSVTTPPAPAIAPAPLPSPPETPSPAPVPDAELAAYQEAHAAHFRGTDAAAALAAWDRYLARFPAGQLAPEARYDRAIVLVKLGRWSEARAALTPFASAPAGTYRQREAAQILDAIRGR